MISFKVFTQLHEQDVGSDSKKRAVFTFGRFNPPTKGHEKIFNAVYSIANQRDADPFIFPSQTTDKKKNPLTFDQKVMFLNRLFPDMEFMEEQTVRNAHDVIEWLANNGYSDVTFVVGSDRVPEFEKRWLPYANKFFDHAAVVSAGSRDPDAEGIAGMSATKARQAAVENDLAKFRSATGWSGELAEQMMKTINRQLTE